MKLKIYCFLIISLFLQTAVNGQNVEDVVTFANEQFEEGNYSIASKEYNRALFFGYPDNAFVAQRIAECYTYLEQYELAGDFYDRAYRFSKSDSMKNEAVLGKSFCHIIEKQFMLGLRELLNFNESSTPEQQASYYFLKGISYFGLKDDSASYNQFIKIANYTSRNTIDTLTIKKEFEKIYRYPKRYNPQRAYIMSGIIPGSGQFVSGEITAGLNSLLLISGLYILSARVIHLYSFWDAAIALFPWIQRYYLGGMDHSKELAKSKIRSKRYSSYLKVLEASTPQQYE
jgi:tetratricopeptide (TPR) repeat protein